MNSIPKKNINIFGLNTRDMQTLHGILKKYPSIETVFIFGSRAKGNYKQGSDIDLAIMNNGIEEQTVRQLKKDFEESTLPYFVDLVDYPTLKPPELKDHIDRIGMIIYQK